MCLLPQGRAFLFYLLVVAVGSTGFYFSNKVALIEAVDAELRIGAASIPYLLAEDFHDRALTAESISASEDQRNIADLSKFVDRTRFAFVYTMIKKSAKIHEMQVRFCLFSRISRIS